MGKKLKTYQGEQISISFEAQRCIHAAECVQGLPQVFDLNKHPWVNPDAANPDAIAEVIERCPSGALKYQRQDGQQEVGTDKTSITAVPGGPLYLRGQLKIALPDGEALEETRAALCRCGASKNKPFCDGSHSEVGFDDD